MTERYTPCIQLFGDKNQFAIELASTKKPKMFRLRFWIENVKIGLFTKANSLADSMTAYGKYIKNKEHYYLPLFDNTEPAGIPFYLLGIDVSTLKININSEEFHVRQKLFVSIGIFGEQFFNSAEPVFFLYKKPDVVCIICKKGIFGATRQSVPFDYFSKVFEEYLSYCKINELV